MKFSLFEKLKSSSVYITPNLPVIQTKRYKFSLLKLFGFFSVYTVFAIAAFMILLIITPLKDYVYFIENEKLDVQSERIKELEGKVVFLMKELESISSTNKKLKYALILAGTDSVDTSAAIYDSLRSREQLPVGGNILLPVMKLLGTFFGSDSNAEKIIFIRPSDGFIIKDFDPQKGHMGIDFAVREGSPVYATAGGIVVFANHTVEDGKMMIIQHGSNYFSVYKHCSALNKKERDVVLQGELIALSGNTGYNTTGPHLHFEIWENGKAVDPQKFLSNL